MAIDFRFYGGTLDPEPDSVCHISYWHIPGGYDYHHAEVRVAYFADKEVAEKLAAKYHMPPEMAMVMDGTGKEKSNG